MAGTTRTMRGPTLRGALKVRVWPIAFQMIALSVGLCAAAILVLTLLGYRSANKGLNTEVGVALNADARDVTDSLDSYNTQHLTDAETFAAFPQVQNLLQPGQTPELSDLLTLGSLASSATTSREDITSIILVRRDQSVVIDTGKTAAGPTQFPAELFQTALSGKTAFSGVLIAPNTGNRITQFAVPVKGQAGDVIGVLVAQSPLTMIDNLVQEAKGRLGEATFGILLDSNNIVMSTSRDQSWLQHPVGTLSADQVASLQADHVWSNDQPLPSLQMTTLVQQLSTSQPRPFSWTIDGDTYHVIRRPARTAGWSYVEAVPLSTYDAPVHAFLHDAVIAAIVVMSMAALLAVALVRLLTVERRRFVEREHELVHEVELLRVEIDDARREADVRQITETEYFQSLASKAQLLRARSQRTARGNAAT